jgi:hypothetical protein
MWDTVALANDARDAELEVRKVAQEAVGKPCAAGEAMDVDLGTDGEGRRERVSDSMAI